MADPKELAARAVVTRVDGAEHLAIGELEIPEGFVLGARCDDCGAGMTTIVPRRLGARAVENEREHVADAIANHVCEDGKERDR